MTDKRQPGYWEMLLSETDPATHPEFQLYYRGADEEESRRVYERAIAAVDSDGLVPVLRRQGTEFAVYLTEKPPPAIHRTWLHVLLFVLTVASTTVAGALFTSAYFLSEPQYDSDQAWRYFIAPTHLLDGFLYYSVPLMGIMVFHEWGHYVVARYHRVRTSLPFFIPLPVLSFTGTLGALINVRGRMPNRKTLLEVGASGPLLGFFATCLVLVIGLWLTGVQPAGQLPIVDAIEAEGDQVSIQTPPIYDFLAWLFNVPDEVSVHPVALAGWVGLLITSIQLLPVSQLDGGHVLRSVVGREARLVAIPVLLGLVVLGLFSGFPGWLVLGIVLLLTGPLPAFPLDDVTSTTTSERALAVGCLIVFALSFMPTPIVVG